MRIDAGNLRQAGEMTGSSRSDARAQNRAMERTKEGDRASLASGEGRVRSLTAAVGQYAEVRQTKVTALADRIRDGSYDANSRQTAEALMSAMVIQPAA